MEQFDIIVIGAGRASNLALALAKAGKKVALIEKSKLGGTCPNRGCVPSKLLVGYAEAARAVRESSRHHIDAPVNRIDTKRIFDDVNRYIAKIDPSYRKRMNENVTIIKAQAHFLSNKTIQADNRILQAETIVIAVGTRPVPPPIKGAWSSDDLFPLKGNPPTSITIVGGGFIACELANFFDAVGIQTRLIVREDHLLSREDGEIRTVFEREFTARIDTAFQTQITQAHRNDKGFMMQLKRQDGTQSTHQSQALLFAIGRIPNSDTLRLENTDIQTDTRGFIKRNAFFETTAKGVYVVGDAAGEHLLQHAASSEVDWLRHYLLGQTNHPHHFVYMAHGVFSDPEIASVGLTEEEAARQGHAYVSTLTPWHASAKALSWKLSYPATKLIVDPKTYKILGCHLIGPQSTTMIHQVLAVMHIDNDIRHLKKMLYIHPALNEALLSAAVETIKKIRNFNGET